MILYAHQQCKKIAIAPYTPQFGLFGLLKI